MQGSSDNREKHAQHVLEKHKERVKQDKPIPPARKEHQPAPRPEERPHHEGPGGRDHRDNSDPTSLRREITPQV